MIDPVTGALLLAGGFAAARAAWSTWGRMPNGHSADQGRRQHRRACEKVVRQFLNTHGFLAREVATRAEVEGWIADGVAPRQLERRLADRAAAVAGPLLGYQVSRDGRVPVRLPQGLRARHIYCVGRTGSGKTTLLRNFSLQAIEAGEGLAVIAPEAELIHDELLPLIPEHRWQDVVVVDPADLRHPVGFNPLHLADGEDLDLKAAELMAVFKRLCEEGSSGAPRMETILRQALYALLPLPDTTLLDLERLLDRQDDAFRRFVIARTADDDARNFWSRTYPSYPKDAHLSLINRLGRFLRPRTVRTLLCASPRSFDVRAAMDQGKVLLFSLSDGLLGEENAELLGQLIVAKIQLAAMSRADVPQHERRFFTLVADEFQRFAHGAAESYEQMLSRARKYGVGLVLAHQQTGQIPEQLMRGILGNVGTVVAFQVGATDARRLSRELVGEVNGEPLTLEARELLGLRVGEAICRVGRNVFRLSASPPPRGGSARTRQVILDLSRRQFASRPPGATDTPLRNGTDDLDPGAVF
jgi:hypothetical protein